jgi:light-harvesting complex I chlorophyll a/b binding protein 1
MLALINSATAFQGASLRTGAPTRSAVSMAVEDLVGGINDPIFGGTPEGKVWDPLGLGADEAALYRRRVVEIKHGRICMVAFLGMTVGPNDVRRAPHPPLGEGQRACRCTAAAAADADAP